MQRCSDYLLLARPRLGRPSASFEDFDIRIASQWGRTSAAEARELSDKYSEMISSLRMSLRRLGFASSQFLQVIVEAHPDAVRSPLNAATDSLAYGAFGFFHLPGIFGVRILFVGRDAEEPSDLATWPRTLFISANTTKPIVAHELAHLTEKWNSSSAKIWREARGDCLAYLATGSEDFELAAPTTIWRVREDGSYSPIEGQLVRSLRNPEIRNAADLVGSHAAYHDNSQIISASIYRLSVEFGRESATEFLLWMDNQGDLIRDPENPAKDPKAARGEIRSQIVDFFSAVNNWAAETGRLDISAWLVGDMKTVLGRN